MTEAEVVRFLISGNGAMAAGALLWLTMLALRWSPKIGAWVDGLGPWPKRGFAFGMALLPAVALSLTGKASWDACATVALTAFFMATGINRMAGMNPKAEPAKLPPLPGG